MYYLIKFLLKHIILLIISAYITNTQTQTNHNIYQSIQIHSNHQYIDTINKTITITGNVLIQYDSITIHANKVIIINPNQIHSEQIIKAYGNPVTFCQSINNENKILTKSSKLLYKTTDNIITLIGNALFKQNNITIYSNHITYIINNKYIETSDNQNNPTKIVLINTNMHTELNDNICLN